MRRLRRRLQRMGDRTERGREYTQAAGAAATKGREVGTTEWSGVRGREDSLHLFSSPAATRSGADDPPSVRRQDDCAQAKREELGCHARLGMSMREHVQSQKACGRSRAGSTPWRGLILRAHKSVAML